MTSFLFSKNSVAISRDQKLKTDCQFDNFKILSDTGQENSVYDHLEWDVRIGTAINGPIGLSLSTSLAYPINSSLAVGLSTGLVQFRGPTLEYKNERYFHDGATYGYFVNEYQIGDYLGNQSCIGVSYAIPQIKRFRLSMSIYHLRLLGSNYINYKESIRSSGESRSYTYGKQEDEVYILNPLDAEYKFLGIRENDLGLQFGIGFTVKRLGLFGVINQGLLDWGSNVYFGEEKEKANFYNIQLTYQLKK